MKRYELNFDKPNKYQEEECDHWSLDDHGICLDCGVEVEGPESESEYEDWDCLE
jgi:hypothetical protein